ncbi:MAG: hypothetical protein ACXAD7_23935 [Candidatus Kariarchaeaceae archaeon]
MTRAIKLVNNWLEVDLEGLKEISSKKHIVRELISNILDEQPNGATNGKIGIYDTYIIAEDDSPAGFNDLSDSFTLFRSTPKRNKAEVRGRFNQGDKMILAHCNSAEVRSTTGTVLFREDGKREFDPSSTTTVGSVLRFNIDITSKEKREFHVFLKQIKTPEDFSITILSNANHRIVYQKAIAIAETNLPTWYVEENTRRIISRRKTKVLIYDEEESWVYELGIPVQKIEDRFSYDVQQKIPLDISRDTIKENYLRELRGGCANVVVNLLEGNDLGELWVQEALSSKNINNKTFKQLFDKKYPNSVLWSSDSTANERAIANGRQIIHSRTLPGNVRNRAKKQKVIQSSKTLFPELSENKKSVTIEEDSLTSSMKWVEKLCRALAKRTLNIDLNVIFKEDELSSGTLASFARHHNQLTFNVYSLGKSWFNGNIDEIVDLIVHELAHYYDTDMPHINKKYHEALSRLTGQFVKIALEEPHLFQR